MVNVTKNKESLRHSHGKRGPGRNGILPCVEVLTPNVAVFGDEAFMDVIKVT